jgi:hypothetical protein
MISRTIFLYEDALYYLYYTWVESTVAKPKLATLAPTKL